MTDVMIDLEPMGNGPQAAIVAIGAVGFDVIGGKLGESFYEVTDLSSSVDSGLEMDASTVIWWMKQGNEAREAICKGGEPLMIALLNITDWMRQFGEDVRVWGNGASFDNVILASAFRKSRLPVPWKFWNDRCYRTVKAMYPCIKMERVGTHHNALDDAKSQALHLMKMVSCGVTV